MPERTWKIVLIGGNVDDRANVARLLEATSRRYLFEEAETVAAGVRATRDNDVPSCCIMLDFIVSGSMDIEILRLLMEDARPICPMVVLTNSIDAQAGRVLLRAGVQEILRKDWMTHESLTWAIYNAVNRWTVGREMHERDQAGQPKDRLARFDNSAARERKMVDERLLESEERLRLATDFAEVGLWDVDMINNQLLWPASVKAMFGISADAPVSMVDFYTGLHPDDREATTAAFAAACNPEQQALYDVEYRTVGKEDAIVRWVAAKGRGMFDEHGRCVRVIGTAIDISTRKRAEEALRESEASLRMFADAMPTLAWMAHADGWIFWYNQRWYDYTGTTPADMEGWGWESVHDPASLPAVKTRLLASIEIGTAFEMTFPLKGADGVFRPFLTRAVPTRDAEGRITRWFGTNTDISPERAIQARLEASEARLREADRRKDTFLATLAHELRNPLAPLSSAAYLLGMQNLAPEQLIRVSQVIQRQVKHMALLLDDLLDVARITQDKLELKREQVCLSNIVDSAVEAVRPLLERKNHRFHVNMPTDDSVVLNGDPLRLSQILSNLLTNAAKYTDPEGCIELAGFVENGELRLTVKDNGIGIPAKSLSEIFTMFSQVDEATNRSEGGLGIGLALAKGLVEMHNGTIEVHSDGRGHGSEFIVHLPLPEVASASELAEDEPIAVAPVRRVLIVDDNEDAADTLAMQIEIAGHEVSVVHGGRAALSTAQTFGPELALIDIGMPDINGYEVARTLRQTPWGANIYLVALTGWGQEEDKRRTAAEGFNEHLTKPVDSERLMALLAAQLPIRKT